MIFVPEELTEKFIMFVGFVRFYSESPSNSNPIILDTRLWQRASSVTILLLFVSLLFFSIKQVTKQVENDQQTISFAPNLKVFLISSTKHHRSFSQSAMQFSRIATFFAAFMALSFFVLGTPVSNAVKRVDEESVENIVTTLQSQTAATLAQIRESVDLRVI